MEFLPLTQPEFQQVLRVAQRVLINQVEPASHVQSFLVARLQDDFPETARKIAHLNDAQIHALWEQVCNASYAGTASALWE